eukprot:gene31490-6676_t
MPTMLRPARCPTIARRSRPSIHPAPRKVLLGCYSIQDPYTTLGVCTSADEHAVKKAFRQQALKCHPDVSKAPVAEVQFVKLTEAYDFIIKKLRGGDLPDHFSSQSSGEGSWDFHDWYWQFRIKRSWANQTRRSSSASASPNTASCTSDPSEEEEEGREGGCHEQQQQPHFEHGFNKPESKQHLNSQLAGLKKRAAARASRVTPADSVTESKAELSHPSHPQPSKPPFSTSDPSDFHNHHETATASASRVPSTDSATKSEAELSQPSHSQPSKPPFSASDPSDFHNHHDTAAARASRVSSTESATKSEAELSQPSHPQPPKPPSSASDQSDFHNHHGASKQHSPSCPTSPPFTASHHHQAATGPTFTRPASLEASHLNQAATSLPLSHAQTAKPLSAHTATPSHVFDDMWGRQGQEHDAFHNRHTYGLDTGAPAQHEVEKTCNTPIQHEVDSADECAAAGSSAGHGSGTGASAQHEVGSTCNTLNQHEVDNADECAAEGSSAGHGFAGGQFQKPKFVASQERRETVMHQLAGLKRKARFTASTRV